MNAKEAEQIFENYLISHGLGYKRDSQVGPGNVDFLVESNSMLSLCDVKAIEKGPENGTGELWAYHNIRKDIKKLRKKFGVKRPSFALCSCVHEFLFNLLDRIHCSESYAWRCWC